MGLTAFNKNSIIQWKSAFTCSSKCWNFKNHKVWFSLVNGVWHHYDGLWERNSRGQGLKKCTGKPSTPSGFLLSHCVYIFEKILHESGPYPLICCECRLIFKAQKHRWWIKISLFKKSNICLKKNSCRGVHLKKNSCTSRERKKKIRASWKFSTPPITFLMVRPLSRISRTPQCVYKCLKCY